MSQYVIAVDQGTTSTRAIIFDHSGSIVSSGQMEHEQIFPQAGWVEHSAAEIWNNTREVIASALSKANLTRHDVAGVGITNQRETAVVWDKTTGEAVYNAIVWQDTRTQDIVNELARDGGPDRLKQKVGLPLATYFSGTKIKWILDNVDGAREKAEAGNLVFGNTDAWVLWNLTGGVDGGVHVTDVTNASRTLFMDLETLQWGEEIVHSKNGLLTTVGYKLGDAAPHYALEGSIAVTGSLIQWLRDNLGMISSAPEVESLAASVKDNGGVYIVPAFSGLFAPYWRSDARGAIVGLTRFVNRNHIARAALEATAFQTREVLDAVNADSGVPLTELKVDGGMVANDALMQFQADILGVPVIRPKVVETTALGAAYAAGLAVGFWKDLGELSANWSEDKRWEPNLDTEERERQLRLWKKAVTKSMDWVD